MAKRYWSGVGNRLKSLGKTILDAAAPVAVDYAVNMAVEKACDVIEQKLKAMYRQTIINSAITLGINVAGILVLVFKPFGIQPSRYVAMGIFASAMILSFSRFVLFLKNNGKTTLDVLKHIYKEKSVYTGIEKYVLTNFPLISLGYAGISIASEYVPSLKQVPRIGPFVKHLVGLFWKRVTLFAGIMAFYTVLVFWVIKPMLMQRFY